MKTGFKFVAILIILGLALIAMPAGKVSAAADVNCTTGCDQTQIQAAIDAALPGATITVAGGPYVLTAAINVNKAVTLSGIDHPLIQVSGNTGGLGNGERIIMQTAGGTLQGFWIEKTDKAGTQNIIYVGANNLTIQNNKIWGRFVIATDNADPASRAMVFTGGLSGLLITNNEIFDLRQPAYISGVTTGTISNNLVYRTKGWVLEQGNMIFTGNTWGTGTDANVYDIAILSGVGASYYTDVLAMAAANNNAFIEDQRTSPYTLSTVYVDGSVGTSGDGTARSPKKTIAEGVTRVIPGGTINVAAGTYPEQVVINKSLKLLGAGFGTIIKAPATLPGSGTQDSYIVKVAGSGVSAEIANLTVSGPGPSSCGSMGQGIVVRESAYAYIHDSQILDVRDSTFSGCQNGIAIQVGRQVWSTTGTAKIENNTITGYQKGGIVVDNTGSSAQIIGNIITGAGTTDVTAQNGIQISRGATATITGNTVTGNSYHNDLNVSNWGATGILVYQSGAVTLGGGNILSGNSQNLSISAPTGTVTVGAESFGALTGPLTFSYHVTNLSTFPINLSQSTFDGLAFSSATPEQILPFAGLIWDGIDNGTSGVANLKTGYQFVDSEGKIQYGINAATPGDVVMVGAGIFDEDVNINKPLTLKGAGAASTTIRGQIGGDNATVRVAANNVTVDGFTITRVGNNPTDWNDAGLNSAGLAIQGTTLTGTIIQNNTFSGNRTGIDINNSSGHTIQYNAITDNRTGLVFRNQTDSMTVVHNEITNNWTVGIVFLDGSAGQSNIPVQTALFSTFSFNNISGNWYGQVVERQTGGSLPLPGTTNLKNFVKNWWGATPPTVSTANSTEPGYAAQIPPAYGGSATPPVTPPADILGPASANIVYAPWCLDSSCSTFDAPVHNVTQDTYFLTIQAALDDSETVDGDTITVKAGTYNGVVEISKSITLLGPNVGVSGTGTRTAEAIIGGSTDWVQLYVEADDVTIDGFTFDGATLVPYPGYYSAGIYSEGNDLTFQNNILVNHSEIAFLSSGGYPGYISGVSVKNNLITNVLNNDGYNFGIYMQSTVGEVIGNTVTNTRSAIQVQPYSAVGAGLVKGNTFEAYRRPVWFNYAQVSGASWQFTENIIRGIAKPIGAADSFFDAVRVETFYAGSVSFSKNQILLGTNDFTEQYLYREVNVTGGISSATPNWWGSACGPNSFVGNAAYSPWYADAAMTTTVSGATGSYTFAPGTSTAAMNATIACAAPGSTFTFQSGNHNGNIVIPAGREHLTFTLKNGANINANSPCFTVNASYTTITTESIGGAKCIPTGGSNGIDVASGLVNIILKGMEIDGTGQTTGAGISFAGAIEDLQVVDNYIHDLDGDGLLFNAQPAGVVDIQGNMFKANGGLGVNNLNGTAPINAAYNSWGSQGGPEGAGGDGVSDNVTFSPWTNVDLYLNSADSPWSFQVVKGSNITITVKGDLQNVTGASFKLLYDASLLDLTSATPTTLFQGVPPSGTLLNTATDGVVKYDGFSITPVSGLAQEFYTLVFKGTASGTAYVRFDETTDVFGMSPAAGPSSNIYANTLTDGSVKVIDLPTLTIVPLETCYAGLPCQFQLHITNPVNGENPTAPWYLDFTVPTGTILEFNTGGTTWVPISSGWVLGGVNPNVSITPTFRATFFTPGSNPMSVFLMDPAPAPDFQLATDDETFAVAGNFSLLGTFSMQGRVFRGGIPVTFTWAGTPSYAPLGTTVDIISKNLSMTLTYGGVYTITTNQPRYLNVTADLGKTVEITGARTLASLELKGGNAVWTDNIIDILDAGQIGGEYASPTPGNGDVNFDGIVNIQDLALVGSNWHVTSASAYGTWAP